MSAKMGAVAPLLLLSVMVSGCLGRARYPEYYALAIAPAAGSPTGAPASPATVAVCRFETPGYLRQGRVVYREGPDRVGFYEYDRWAEEPGTTVTAAMVEALRNARLFAAVVDMDSQSRPDYLLTGRLERLDELDYGGTVQVEVQISASLTNLRTGDILWTGEAEEIKGVEERDMNAVIAQMSDAVQRSIRLLVGRMGQHFSQAELNARGSQQ